MDSGFLITLLSAFGGLSLGLIILAMRRHSGKRTGGEEFVHLPLRAQGAYKGMRVRHAGSEFLHLPFAALRQEKMKGGPGKKAR